MPPDRLVLDLDPGEGAGLAECVEVARLARTILQDVGLDPVPVTSGSKGIHLYAALDGTQSSDQISEFAHELARSLEADHPDLAVSDMKKTLRTGKVLVDWSQNNAAKTTIVPYSLRGRLRPTVAAPRTWRELSSPSLHQLDYQEVLKRVKAGKDPFAADLRRAARAGRAAGRNATPGPTPAKRPGDGGDTDPRLETYRTKRDAAPRPEPFTAERHRQAGRTDPAAARSGRSSSSRNTTPAGCTSTSGWSATACWCPGRCPRASPPSKTKNHLAVQTEDHPMDYAGLRRHHPQGPVRRRDHEHLGPRVLRVREVDRGQGGHCHPHRPGRRRPGRRPQVRPDPHRPGRRPVAHPPDGPARHEEGRPASASARTTAATTTPAGHQATAARAPGRDRRRPAPAALAPEDFQPDARQRRDHWRTSRTRTGSSSSNGTECGP